MRLSPSDSEERVAGLYVHIPFCRTKCPYCSFISSPPVSDTVLGRYMSALIRQVEVMADHPWVAAWNFSSLFIGGGTPTIYDGERLSRLIEACLNSFRFKRPPVGQKNLIPEVSVEANPNTVTLQKLVDLKQAGVNRLSIGIQSFSDSELRVLGRSHSSAKGFQAIESARKAGFDNVSLDLMFGLPHQELADWQSSLKTALELRPEHFSLYELMIEEETPFARLAEKKQLSLPDENTVLQMASIAEETMEAGGYERYEISNYARPGFQCNHNINYWENGSYLGLGAGAVSFFSGIRIKNVTDPSLYTRFVEQDKLPFLEGECLPMEAGFRETMIMGLRMISGVSCERLKMRFGFTPHEYYGQTLSCLIRQNLIEEFEGHLKLTRNGLPVADQVLAQLV